MSIDHLLARLLLTFVFIKSGTDISKPVPPAATQPTNKPPSSALREKTNAKNGTFDLGKASVNVVNRKDIGPGKVKKKNMTKKSNKSG